MLIESFEVVNSIFKNKMNLRVDSGYYRFERFTAKQLEVYADVPHTRSRSLCTSGVCMDFISDTEYVKFEYKIYEMARDWMFFDIYINDVLVDSIGSEPIAKSEGVFEYHINNGSNRKNRITIYLPHLCNCALSHIEISDGSGIEAAGSGSKISDGSGIEAAGSGSKISDGAGIDAAESGGKMSTGACCYGTVGPASDSFSVRGKTLLCLGDSITQGMESRRPSMNFAVQLSRYFGMNLINQGVGGYSFRKISLDPQIGLNPTLVIIAYGTNDWDLCGTLERFVTGASGYINTAAEIFSKSRIVVLSPIWRSDFMAEKPAGTFFEISNALREICKGLSGVEFIDGLGLVPHKPGLFTDGLHPNEDGFIYYTENLINRLSSKS